ncbi:hypothetical protein GBAR_LOCUS31718 [Geodia barretti]|uniref:Uncharacterized protein n=1 Tax=Geodia barretti TaxID=519541 RepID=A0AA35U1B0_GEOBA|nr:hypothetical protein GBAR_LOCUS31718 [Geodia barretti]
MQLHCLALYGWWKGELSDFSQHVQSSQFRYHSFPWSLDWTVSDRYFFLPTDKTLATYIWIDATGQQMRSYILRWMRCIWM